MTVVSFAYKTKDNPNIQLGMNGWEGVINTVEDWNNMMEYVVNARPDVEPTSVIILNLKTLA